jgi:hypothetical protein
VFGIDCDPEDEVSAEAGNVQPLAIETAAINVSPACTDALVGTRELGWTRSGNIFQGIKEAKCLFAPSKHYSCGRVNQFVRRVSLEVKLAVSGTPGKKVWAVCRISQDQIPVADVRSCHGEAEQLSLAGS